MKVDEARELLSLIKRVYDGEVYPEAFAEATGLYDTYLEELWPVEEDKLIGDWIAKRFSLRLFLDETEIKEFCKRVGDEFREVLFYANFPNQEVAAK